MRSHRYDNPNHRRLERAAWAALTVVLIVFGGGFAYAALTPSYTDQCVRTAKANGGITLDCDPIAAPSSSPSSSPSVSPSSSPTPAPTTPSPSPTSSSPSPTPTTASPSPTGTLNGCMTRPGDCGFPDASSTGAHGTLTVVNGNITLSTAGMVYADKDVRGCINVTAPNVVIRDVKVACASEPVINYSPGSMSAGRLTIEDTTVVCTASLGGTGIGDRNITSRRVDVSGCANGWDLDWQSTVEDSYCHDLDSELDANGNDNGLHTDCIQGIQTTNVVIRHNTLIAPFYSTSSIGGCCNPFAGTPPTRTGWLIDGNLMQAGAYTLYCGISYPESGTIVRNNRFGFFGWNGATRHNYAIGCTDTAWSNNVADDTGAALAAA